MPSGSYLSCVLSALGFHVVTYARMYWCALALSICVLAGGIYWVLFVPAPGFPDGHLIVIPSATSVPAIAGQLSAERVIVSPLAMRVVSRLTGADGSLQAGTYFFQTPLGLWQVLTRLRTGEAGIARIRVTLTEGMTTREMGRALAQQLPDFDTAAFDAVASQHEGYLFPDTYYFMASATPDDIVALLQTTFADRVATIQAQVDAFGRSFSDDVIMASLIEREAKTLEDKRMIAGILWNRVTAKMPLQVDAVFGYIDGTGTHAPTAADLASTSHYNTYRYPGLPPGPISNPGLDSLLAAVTPTKTDYLYYLTGDDGHMHYAKTFAEHKANRARYLK